MSYTPWQWAAMATLATLVLFLLQLLVISTLLPSAEPLLPPLEEEAEPAPWHEELQQLTKRLEGLEASSRTAGELEARGEARVLELEGRLDRSTARLGQVEARVGEVATLARGQGEGAREEVRSLKEEMEVLKGDLLKVKTEGVKGEVEMKVGEKVVEDVVEDVVETVVTRVMEEVQKSITVKEENLKGILHKEIEKMKSEVVIPEKGDETNDQDKKVFEEMAEEVARLRMLVEAREEEEVGEVDWAGEEVGGRVTSSSPSSPLAALPSLHLLGLPIWWGSNTAQAVLQVNMSSYLNFSPIICAPGGRGVWAVLGDGGGPGPPHHRPGQAAPRHRGLHPARLAHTQPHLSAQVNTWPPGHLTSWPPEHLAT